MPGVIDEYLLGYKKENRNILKWRLRLLDPDEVKEVLAKHPVGQMRMLLEVKSEMDGRKPGEYCKAFVNQASGMMGQ